MTDKAKKESEPTTLIRVTQRAHRAVKIEAAKQGVSMTALASEKLLASSAG